MAATLDSTLAPDCWVVLANHPKAAMYGQLAPEGRHQHTHFNAIRRLPLLRIPESKNGVPFRPNRPISYVAAVLAAVGGRKAPADRKECAKCAAGGRGGMWTGGCIIPQTVGLAVTLGMGCANCMYQGETSRCKYHDPPPSPHSPFIFRSAAAMRALCKSIMLRTCRPSTP